MLFLRLEYYIPESIPESMKKNKILILFAHPLYEKSKVNQILNSYIPDSEYITFHDLYEEYPEFEIDIRHEQELIRTHDIIIWQHPMYWYSCPALLKQWMDMVLQFRNPGDLKADQLRGKAVFQVMSIGEQQVSLIDSAADETPIAHYLTPFRRVVEFCNMQYLPPFLVRVPKMSSIDDIHRKGEYYQYILEAIISNFVSSREMLRFDTLNDWITFKNQSFG